MGRACSSCRSRRDIVVLATFEDRLIFIISIEKLRSLIIAAIVSVGISTSLAIWSW